MSGGRPGVYDGESHVTRSAGAIFYIQSTDEFMFFRRDNKKGILCPDEVDILGGGMQEGEMPEEAARREFAEELTDRDTDKPFSPPQLYPFICGQDYGGVEQNLYGCELATRPNLQLHEGQGLVFLSREQLAATKFAFGYEDFAQRYAATIDPPNGQPTGLNYLVYPKGYFQAHVAFARTWAALYEEPLHRVLFERTAAGRAILGAAFKEVSAAGHWEDLLSSLDADTANTKEYGAALHRLYAAQPHSRYTDPVHKLGALTYRYHRHEPAVQLHFDNPKRGTSPLSGEALAMRREEFRALLQQVQAERPDTQRFIAGSWLFSTRAFRSLFPPDINLQTPPDFSYAGDSLWGQFMDKNGNASPARLERFAKALGIATADTILDAFPFKTLFTNDNIGKYYEHYRIA